MGYSYKGYWLHKTKGRGGATLYYFSKKKAGSIPLPAGRKVVGVNKRTGLPFLGKTKRTRRRR